MKNRKTVLVLSGLLILSLLLGGSFAARAAPQVPQATPVLYLPAIVFTDTGKVSVVNSSAFVPYASSTSLYLVGEVLNETSANIRAVIVTASLRDADGNEVAKDESFTTVCCLSPGMKSPFINIFTDVPAWETYVITTTWKTTTNRPYPMDIVSQTSSFDTHNAFHVTGQVMNSFPETHIGVKASVTLYNLQGEVIGVGASATDPATIDPGQTGTFDVIVYYWIGKPDQSQIGSYSLQVIGD